MIRQHLQLLQTAYPNITHDAALSASSDKQLFVHSVAAFNAAGSTNALAICHSLTTPDWKIWTKTASVANVTATIQAGTAITIFPTTNTHGFYAQAKSKFGMLSFVISQAGTGSPSYDYTYWNGASWASLDTLQDPAYDTTGKYGILFNAPLDWVVGGGSTGIDESLYSIRALGTTAPSTAVKVSSLKVGHIIVYRSGIPDKQQLQVIFKTRQLLLQQGESIVGFFSIANALNSMEAAYQISP